MAYHPLTNDSGGDDESRAIEARKICSMLESDIGSMNSKERNFVMEMADTNHCSVKQLFWLRDIKDKYYA